MCVGLVTMRVTELWMPPRVPVICDPGVLMIFSWAWYIMHMIGGYAQLSYGFNYYGTIGTNRDEFVVVRKMSKVDWMDEPAAAEAATELSERSPA